MNWYIGQEVVALITRKDFGLKEGNIYTIRGLMRGCAHHQCLLNVGVTHLFHTSTQCEVCSCIFHSAIWLSPDLFASLEHNSEAIAELLEQTQKA